MSIHLILAILLVVAIVVTMTTMLWLMIYARALIALFQKPSNELSAGPAPLTAPHPARRTVWAMLILFNIAWISGFLIFAIGMKEAAEGPPDFVPTITSRSG